ncbi:protein DpdE [Deinococcus sp. LM3]|uniref:protein DpdE n=1 Tax=Deinococcus sp. LM3 TaxID=1938608 RepID=UPI00143B2DD4|nr:protein DpdE [Deinococcus sp. LM3]
MTSIRVGQLVTWKTQADLGTAKVTAVQGATASIDYFVSVAKRRPFEAPLNELEPFTPWPQNRVYIRNEGQWQMGRIGAYREDPLEAFYIRFPNDKAREIPEHDVYLRSAGEVQPVEVLKLHGHETPFFFNERWPLVQALTEQRGASRGITALLSSAVDLRDHQVDVIRRVLHDPVQRYLLADEVGLGKTIEAGVIVRQFLIDHPQGRVAFLVPAHLQEQWQQELHHRFFLHDFPQAHVHVLAHGTAALPPSDFVVIDEAHHLAEGAFGAATSQEQFQTLARWVHASPRLLLLSATPASSDQDAYLGMLNLLDPGVYRLADRDAFETRVRERERIGMLFFALQPEVPAEVLQPTLDEVLSLFPDDARASDLISELMGVSETEVADRHKLIGALRTHLSETYRLHRRMLRHRRAAHAEHLVRGRTLGQMIDVPQQDARSAWEAFDTWREALAEAHERGELPFEQAASFLSVMWEAASAGPAAWRDAATSRLQHRSFPAGTAEREALTLMLTRLKAINPDGLTSEINRTVEQLIRTEAGKIVVFASLPSTVRAIGKALKHVLGDTRVANFLDEPDAVRRFQQSRQCQVLVVDQSGEEGLNLQCGDVLVHLDVPLNPNRLEQRLGRLDRYGRGKPIVSYVLQHDSWPEVLKAHTEVMAQGLGIYDRSVASLQFLIDSLRTEEVQAVLGGAPALRTWAQTLPERIREELDRLDMSEMLDAIQPEANQELAQMMDDLGDAEAQGFERIFTCWVTKALLFRATYTDSSVQFSFVPHKTLVPWERIAQTFKHVQNRPSTFSRREAQLHRHHLLRAGEPFVDALTEYFSWDDRGRAYAFWRAHPAWVEDPTVVFAFHYVIEGDLRPVQNLAERENLDMKVLRRQLDSLLRPCTRTIYVDRFGKVLPGHVQAMVSPSYQCYEGAVDHNLNPQRLWALTELMPQGEWLRACDEVERVAEGRLRTEEQLTKHLEQAAQTAESRLHERLEQLRSRHRSGRADVTDRGLAVETELLDALLKGVRTPCLHLDSVGAVVLSTHTPFRDQL